MLSCIILPSIELLELRYNVPLWVRVWASSTGQRSFRSSPNVEAEAFSFFSSTCLDLSSGHKAAGSSDVLFRHPVGEWFSALVGDIVLCKRSSIIGSPTVDVSFFACKLIRIYGIYCCVYCIVERVGRSCCWTILQNYRCGWIVLVKDLKFSRTKVVLLNLSPG